jgi:hypothetical protein
MATRDANLTFCKQQAAYNNTVSTNIIDLSAIRDIGVGKQPYIIVQVDGEAMTDSGNNSNTTVYFQTDGVEAFNSATNSITLGTFVTNSAIGTKIGPIPIPPGKADEQYCALYFSQSGTGDLTTGKFTGWITYEPQLHDTYPDAVTISVP